LGVSDRSGKVIVFERVVGSVSLARDFNAGTPAEIVGTLPGITLLIVALFCRRAAVDVVSLSYDSACEDQNHDKAKASERKPAFHVVTTLQKDS
jgi:hypothetical protein